MPEFPPAHPGNVLREDYLAPLGVSPAALAGAIGLPLARVEPVLRAEARIAPDMALRLARYFGTTAEFWVTMQAIHDSRARCGRGLP